MNIFLTILILVFFVAVTEVLKKTLLRSIPLPVIQIIIGGGMSIPFFDLNLSLEPDIFIFLFIPPLLFVDGVKTESHQLLKKWKDIVSLAIFLVIFSIVIVGIFLNYTLPNVPFWACIALAAILSPTDIVALNGMLGTRNIPSKITSIIEGEALMNDASALVSFKISILILLGVIDFSFETFAFDFIKVAVGGIFTGILVVYLYITTLKFLSRWLSDEPTVQVVLLMLLPFLCYLIAEKWGVSGILSAVAAGLFVRHSKFIEYSPISMQNSAKNVWSMFETLFNGMIFIILGSQIPSILTNSIENSKTDEMNFISLSSIAFFVYVLLVATRLTWVLIQGKILPRIKLSHTENYTIRESLIITFSGVRGAITLAGVLSIPMFIGDASFSERYQLVFIATSVILLSIFFSILALPLLIPQKERNVPKCKAGFQYELMAARLKTMSHIESELISVSTKLTRYSMCNENEFNETINNIIHIFKMQLVTQHSSDDKVQLKNHILFKVATKSGRAYIEKLKNDLNIDKQVKRKILDELSLLEAVFHQPK